MRRRQLRIFGWLALSMGRMECPKELDPRDGASQPDDGHMAVAESTAECAPGLVRTDSRWVLA